MSTWLLHWLGIDSASGAQYLAWSGSGSVILPWLMNGLTFAGLLWFHHRCHVTGCWRYARRVTAASERACRRHHPEPHRTAGEIEAAHHAAKARRAA